MRSGVVCRVTDNAQRLESAAAAPAAKARGKSRKEELLRFSRQMQTHVKRYMNTVFTCLSQQVAVFASFSPGFWVLFCFRFSSARADEGGAASGATDDGYGEADLVRLFECAKELLLCIRSSSGLLDLNRLFSAFACQVHSTSAASGHHQSPPLATAAAAAAAAAAYANYDVFSDTLSLAHATHHALLAALQPPAAAAIASRCILQAAIKTLASLRSRLLRGAAASPSRLSMGGINKRGLRFCLTPGQGGS